VPPHSRIGDIAVEIEELLMPHLSGGRSEPQPLSFSTIDAGYELPDRGEIPQKLQEVFTAQGRSWTPGAFRSHSDANLLWASGVKPVILGPGQLAVAHTAHESVAFSEVAAAARIYLDFLMKL
jgi:acetylornithine deacetylase